MIAKSLEPVLHVGLDACMAVTYLYWAVNF